MVGLWGDGDRRFVSVSLVAGQAGDSAHYLTARRGAGRSASLAILRLDRRRVGQPGSGGILGTSDAASPIGAAQVGTASSSYVYAIVFSAGIGYINRLIDKGPSEERDPPVGVANRPITAATSGEPEGPTGAAELR
jgi:hypothetical protein